MSDLIVELSTGHVFVKGSVKGISPVAGVDYIKGLFRVIGVGFTVDILVAVPIGMRFLSAQERAALGNENHEAINKAQDGKVRAYVEAVRQEFIDKLLK